MNIKSPITIGHLREIAETVDKKLNANGRVQQTANYFIEKGFLLDYKFFSMIKGFSTRLRNVGTAPEGNSVPEKVDPRDLLLGNGKFKLNANNAVSFGNCLKAKGAKFIVDQLTDKEIFDLMNSEFLSISQKSQIFEAYEGRNKTSLEALFAEQLNEKLAPLGFNEDSIAKFFGVLPDPQKFANYMLDILSQENITPENLPDILKFCFGPGGLFPLQDLPETHKRALSNALSQVGEKLVPTDRVVDKEVFRKAGMKMIQLLTLKYALDIKAEEMREEKMRILKNCIVHGTVESLLDREFNSHFAKSKQDIKLLSNVADLKDKAEQASDTFDYLTTEASPTEVAIFQFFQEAGDDYEIPNNVMELCEHWVSEMESSDAQTRGKGILDFINFSIRNNLNPDSVLKLYPEAKFLRQLCEIFVQVKGVNGEPKLDFIEKLASQLMDEDLQKRMDGISEFILACIEKNLDPTPILSLYPQTTLEVFREQFEGIRYRDSQRTHKEFFDQINILIAIGSRAKDIFPLPPVSKDFSEAEAYQHFLGNFQTLLNKLIGFREKYVDASNKEEIYKEASTWLRSQISALQGAIRTFESLCEDAHRTV